MLRFRRGKGCKKKKLYENQKSRKNNNGGYVDSFLCTPSFKELHPETGEAKRKSAFDRGLMRIDNIETPRLTLRGFTKEDALWAYSIWNDPEMGQYLPDEAKEKIDDEYLKMLEGLGEDDECCYLIPVFKDSLERVGTCSFMISDDQKVYDIAYCVHKKYWRQGYATEIAQGMIDYARSQGAEKVTIFVSQENAASNRVAQKCGGKIVSESTYKKRGTDLIMKDYKYEVIL